MQAVIRALSKTTSETIGDLYDMGYPLDLCIAVIMIGVGDAIATTEERKRQHNTVCNNCAKAGEPDFYELALKNFREGFVHGKRAAEAESEATAAQADDMLAKVFKEHKK